MILSLTAGFVNNIDNSSLPSNVKSAINDKKQSGVPIASADQVESAAMESGLSQTEAQQVSQTYSESQLTSLKLSMFVVAVLGLASMVLSRNIPAKKLITA